MRTTAFGPSSFMPPQGTDLSQGVDSLYEFLLVASFISCVLVIGGLILFAVKYRRTSETQKSAYIAHNAALEFLWSFIPFVIFMVVFVWGWRVFHQLRAMPDNALEVAVEAQKWDWSFVYKSGRRAAGEFYVPVGQNVKLVMTSKDVLHSLFVPSFRTKQDVVPGRYTALWFRPNYEGVFQIFCTEYCGDKHSAMMAKVHVVSQEKFEEWLSNDPYKGVPSVEIGQKVYSTRCVACHTLTEAKNVGPGFKGVFGRQENIEGGETVVVDENYIRESVLNPNAKVVAGFPAGVMPTFAGQLSEQELMGIIDYLKTLK
jgi:cytochrome c oxidase subunit II